MLQPTNLLDTHREGAGWCHLHSAACDCLLQQLLDVQGVLFADRLVFLAGCCRLGIPLIPPVLCSCSRLQVRDVLANFPSQLYARTCFRL